MRIRTTVVTLFVSALLWSLPALAQQRPSTNVSPAAVGERHVVDAGQMRQALASQAQTDQQNRDVVLGVLRQSQVRDLAGRLGLSVTRAEGAVSTLNSAELARLAGPARMAATELAGGSQVIVISLTTLLLILIIVILLVR